MIINDTLTPQEKADLLRNYNLQQMEELLYNVILKPDDNYFTRINNTISIESQNEGNMENDKNDLDIGDEIKSLASSFSYNMNDITSNTQTLAKKALIIDEYKKRTKMKLSNNYSLGILQEYLKDTTPYAITSITNKTDLINEILKVTLGYFNEDVADTLKTNYKVNQLQEFLFSVIIGSPAGIIYENEGDILFKIPKTNRDSLFYNYSTIPDLKKKILFDELKLLNKIPDTLNINDVKTQKLQALFRTNYNGINSITNKQHLIETILYIKKKQIGKLDYSILNTYSTDALKELLYNILLDQQESFIQKVEGKNFI